MSGIVGSKLNIRGSGLVGSLGTDGQHLLSSGAGVSNVFETVAAGGDNTPAFSAMSVGNQAITDATWTKVHTSTELLDSDTTYDNDTNYRFTPAVAGTFLIYGRVNIDTADNDDGGRDVHISIYKNGALYTRQQNRLLGYPQRNFGVQISAVIVFDDDDYVELYAYCDDGQGSPVIDGSERQTWFYGVRIT